MREGFWPKIFTHHASRFILANAWDIFIFPSPLKPLMNSGFTLRQKFLLGPLRLLIWLLLRLEVTGLENIPAYGPVIIIINHLDLVDPAIVCGVSFRPVIPLAKNEAFHSPLLGPLVRFYGAIPLRRGEADTGAVKAALQVLQANGAILLAPEGSRSPTGQLRPGKKGAALIALRSGAPVVPIGLVGTPNLGLSWRKFQRAPVRLSVGKPFWLHACSAHGPEHRAETALMTQELMMRLALQLPPELRGVYNCPDPLESNSPVADPIESAQRKNPLTHRADVS
jgi:1-acyl-sn-glycerol-3-phosphate acyltransferase